MEQDLPQPIVDLLFIGLDHGVDSVRASGGPLTPFVIVQRGSERAMTRYSAATLEAQLDDAVAAARSTQLGEGDFVVLVYDAYLSGADGRTDAIFAEAIDAAGHVTGIAQRYRPKAMLRRFETIGNPALLPPGISRLRADIG